MVSCALVVFVVAASPAEQVHAKRLEQVADLERIIKLSGRQADLLFRLADLWVEESRALILEEKPNAAAGAKAIALFTELAQSHPDFARADEVLFFLGKTLLDANDDRRAVVAFQRLVTRHPKSRFVDESQFALGEHLFSKSNGRRDWLIRALASYVAASGERSPVRSDAVFKQGWCLLNLGDFEGAQEKFRQVVSLGGPRATDAERDFVRAYEKGGGKALAARAAIDSVTQDTSRRRVLMEHLAKLYRADGFDGDAALTWQALIHEQPRAKEALGYQEQVIASLVRMGKKPLVVAQVQRLVTMASALEGGDLGEAETMLATLAAGWHSECRKTREDGCLAYPSAIYEAYLALFPKAPRAYELRFFHAELLYEVKDFAGAAAEYRLVMERDVACRTTQGCTTGRFMEAAAWGEIKARDAIIAAALPHQGQAPGESGVRLALR